MPTTTALDFPGRDVEDLRQAAALVNDTAIFLHERASCDPNGEELVPFATAYIAAAILVGLRAASAA